MSGKLQQLVIQIESSPTCPRALVQSGDDIFNILGIENKEVLYDSLSDQEKIIWDAFVNMLKNK